MRFQILIELIIRDDRFPQYYEKEFRQFSIAKSVQEAIDAHDDLKHAAVLDCHATELAGD
jgi:hypothetical protein